MGIVGIPSDGRNFLPENDPSKLLLLVAGGFLATEELGHHLDEQLLIFVSQCAPNRDVFSMVGVK